MTASQQQLNGQLVTAVTAKNPDAVHTCLRDGADPNAPGRDGLPLLCAAVAGFDQETAEALMDGGADSDAELPDGTTPLLRAVDLGSPALVGAVLGKDPRLRLGKADRKRLLDLARHRDRSGPGTAPPHGGLGPGRPAPGRGQRILQREDQHPRAGPPPIRGGAADGAEGQGASSFG